MSLKNFLEKTAAQKKPLVVEIGGEELRFHRLRVPALLKARNVVQRVAEAVSAFFDPNDGQYVKHTHQRDKDGSEVTVIDPVSPVTAKERQKRRDEAISEAVSALFDEAHIDALVVLVLDSMREDIDDETVVSFRNRFEVADLAQFVFYMLKANLSVLGPSGESAMDKARGKLVSLFGRSAEQAEKATTRPDGDSSKSSASS